MIDENFKKLFVATHLLYPNSAQARDIVFQISIQLRNRISKSTKQQELALYFLALTQIYKKVQTIKSGFKYFEFREQKLSDWQNFLKKCNANEILIFVGLVILKLDAESISTTLKINLRLIPYLFNLGIKKSIGSTEIRTNFVYTFEMRKYSDVKKTFSVSVEDLIKQIFFTQNLFDSGLVSSSLGLYANRAQSLYSEITNIQVDEQFISEFLQEAKAHNSVTEIATSKPNWILSLFAVIILSITAALYFRPDFTRFFTLIKNDSSLELKEISFSQKKETLLTSVEVKPTSTNSGEILKKEDQLQFDTKIPDLGKLPVASTNNNPGLKGSSLSKNPAPTVAKPELTKTITNETTATKPLPVKQIESGKGGIYRAVLKVKDLQQDSLFAKEKIINLGGKKAGEVELGWVKNANTTYFHFSIPEDGLESLKTELKSLGDLEISLHEHPRIMPQGQRRIILEVQSGS